MDSRMADGRCGNADADARSDKLAALYYGAKTTIVPRGETQQRDARRMTRPPECCQCGEGYLMCLLTSLVISNIETLALPPNTALSLSSALIMRRSFAS